MVPLLRCVPRVVRLRRLVQPVDPAHKEIGIFPRAYRLPPDPVVTTRDLPGMWKAAGRAALVLAGAVAVSVFGGRRK